MKFMNSFTGFRSPSVVIDELNSSEEKALGQSYQQHMFSSSSPQQHRAGAATQKQWWTEQQDAKLKLLVEEYGARNWKKMASFL